MSSDVAAGTDQARLLTDLAQALRHTAATATAVHPEPTALEIESREAAAMPLILRAPASGTSYPSARDRAAARWTDTPRVMALCVGTMISIAFVLAALSGGWPQLLPTSGRASAELLASSLTAGDRDLGADILSDPATPREVGALLVRAQALIALGEVLAARELLARAAAEGNATARFALAETFDPNMLAAWGARGPLADPIVARTLYAQAETAGDNRAARRISALAED